MDSEAATARVYYILGDMGACYIVPLAVFFAVDRDTVKPLYRASSFYCGAGGSGVCIQS